MRGHSQHTQNEQDSYELTKIPHLTLAFRTEFILTLFDLSPLHTDQHESKNSDLRNS